MIGAWRTVFEHQFPDINFQNIRAIPGKWLGDHPPIIERTIGQATGPKPHTLYRAAFSGSKSAEYMLDTPVTDIIGLDIVVSYGIYWQIDPGFSGSLPPPRNDTFFGGTPDAFKIGLTEQKIEANLAGATTRWDSVKFPGFRGVILYRWSIIGQSELYFNGSLVAFRNDVASGKVLTLNSLYMGGYLDASESFIGWINYLRCNVTRWHDADVAIGRCFEIDKTDLADYEKCVKSQSLRQMQLRMHEAIIEFMGQFLRKTSSKWHLGAKGGTPYSKVAVEAHSLAIELGKMFMNRLCVSSSNCGDASTDDIILDKAKRFLQLMADADPENYRRGIEKLKKVLASGEKINFMETQKKINEKYSKRIAEIGSLFERLGQLVLDLGREEKT